MRTLRLGATNLALMSLYLGPVWATEACPAHALDAPVVDGQPMHAAKQG